MSYETSISFRLHQNEHNQIADAALAHNMSISDYCRATMLTSAPTTVYTTSSSGTSSTPQAVYRALAPRIESLEAAVQQANAFIREEDSGNSND